MSEEYRQMTIREWYDLPEESIVDGACPHCNNVDGYIYMKVEIVHRGNDSVIIQGHRDIVTCGRCEKDFRPFDMF